LGKSGKPKVVPGVLKLASGEDVPDHIKVLKIPPAWTEVQVNMHPDGDLLAKGRDAKGRPQSVYSDSHNMRQAAAKFAKVSEIAEKDEAIGVKNETNLSSTDPSVREAAAVTALIRETGIRPGSEQDTGAEHKAYGATTLRSYHVTTNDKGDVRLKFVGKKGVHLSIPVDDPKVAAMLKERAALAGPKGRLFNVSAGNLREYTKTLGGGDINPKDFRTLKGTKIAIQEVNKMKDPKDEKMYKKQVMAVAKTVSKKLGNTPTIALQSYINPAVFAKWRRAA
jgi:DNA topoisomerase I